MQNWQGRYGCAPENASTARREVMEFASTWFSDSALTDIGWAVGEALASAVLRCGADDIEVSCAMFGRTFVVEVTDNGEMAEPVATAGYSLVIMHELMDDVEYVDDGHCIRLTKFIL